VTFAEFVETVDAELRARVAAQYGLYTGPHTAFWQRGAVTARVREGMAEDVELEIAAASAPPRLVAACDDAGVRRVAEAIAANFSAEA
jgi:hypothetical protein